MIVCIADLYIVSCSWKTIKSVGWPWLPGPCIETIFITAGAIYRIAKGNCSIVGPIAGDICRTYRGWNSALRYCCDTSQHPPADNKQKLPEVSSFLHIIECRNFITGNITLWFNQNQIFVIWEWIKTGFNYYSLKPVAIFLKFLFIAYSGWIFVQVILSSFNNFQSLKMVSFINNNLIKVNYAGINKYRKKGSFWLR